MKSSPKRIRRKLMNTEIMKAKIWFDVIEEAKKLIANIHIERNTSPVNWVNTTHQSKFQRKEREAYKITHDKIKRIKYAIKLKNFHQIILQIEIGFVSKNSIVPDLNSSDKTLIERAGMMMIRNQINKSK